MNEPERLVDESLLRRALRLESDERAPRFDTAAIAALADADRPWRRVVVAALAAAALTGMTAGSVWTAIADHLPDILTTLGDGVLAALIGTATFLVPVAEIAAQPAVPLSLLAALGVAIIHELREGKEHAHAHAS